METIADDVVRELLGGAPPPLPESTSQPAPFDADLPEVGSISGLPLKGETAIAVALTFSVDPEAQSDVITKSIPGAVAGQDDQGNAIIDIPAAAAKQSGAPEGRYFLNRPGLSPQDAYSLAGQVLSYIPAGRITGMVGKSAAKRIAAGGALAAGTSIAQDVVMELMGSDQPVSVPRAVRAGATGMVAEAVQPLQRKVAGAIRRQPGPTMGAAAQAAARQAGVNPGTMTPKAQQAL